MYAILFLSVVALAGAAPRYPCTYRSQLGGFTGRDRFHSYFNNDDLFDTKKFWMELSDELLKLDEALEDFSKHFPTSITEEKVEGNQYKITIPLSGFSEKDIIVKARDGLLMVQATLKAGNTNLNSNMNLGTLPANLNVSGTWTYDEGVLTILFPLKEKTETTTETVTETVTDAPKEHSREEMETTSEDNKGDADVGLTMGNKDADILTNEIPNNKEVKKTTYAVDISDEVEFVPIRFK